jgi:hypothetical protein
MKLAARASRHWSLIDQRKGADGAVGRTSCLLRGHTSSDIVSNFLLDVFAQFLIEFGI